MTGDWSGREPALPALPAWKAFVVQFSRETCDMNSGCSGRIEHLSSGRRAHFDSPRQLLAVLERLLLDLGEKDA